MLLGNGLHREHNPGGCRQGVLAQSHRRRTGVVGLTLHLNGETPLTNDALNDTNGVTTMLQHSPLLDVQLQKSRNCLIRTTGGCQCRPVAANALQIDINRLTIAGGIGRRLRRRRSGHALAADHR